MESESESVRKDSDYFGLPSTYIKHTVLQIQWCREYANSSWRCGRRALVSCSLLMWFMLWPTDFSVWICKWIQPVAADVVQKLSSLTRKTPQDWIFSLHSRSNFNYLCKPLSCHASRSENDVRKQFCEFTMDGNMKYDPPRFIHERSKSYTWVARWAHLYINSYSQARALHKERVCNFSLSLCRPRQWEKIFC